MPIPINTIELYLASLPKAQQKALQNIRQLINKLVPEAEEIISYNMPAYRYHGMLVGFAAFKNHCSVFPWNGSTTEHFKMELIGFKTSKGTIQFTLDKPIPVALLKKIIKFRIAQNKLNQKKAHS